MAKEGGLMSICFDFLTRIIRMIMSTSTVKRVKSKVKVSEQLQAPSCLISSKVLGNYLILRVHYSLKYLTLGTLE